VCSSDVWHESCRAYVCVVERERRVREREKMCVHKMCGTNRVIERERRVREREKMCVREREKMCVHKMCGTNRVVPMCV